MHSHSSSRRTASIREAPTSSPPPPQLDVAPSQLFRMPSTQVPLTFAHLPRIILQLVYGYLSLDELGVAACTSRDFHQTAALFRCLLNSATGGVRVRWIGLDAGHGWGYLQRLSLSPLRIHPTVFNALDAQHGWLSHREQIRLLRKFPHINEIHMHYSPDVPIEWGAELEALACRTPIGQEAGPEATAASASSVPPPSSPAYLRAASSSSSSSSIAASSPLLSLQLCPLNWDDVADAQYALQEAEEAANGGKKKDSTAVRFRKALGAVGKAVGSAFKGAATIKAEAEAATAAAVATAAASSSTEECKEAAPTSSAAVVPPPRRRVDPSLIPAHILNPVHPAEPTPAQDDLLWQRWGVINKDLFSRIGRFKSLEDLGLTLRGECDEWDLSGFAELSGLMSLELEVDYHSQLAFGRHVVDLIEIIRDVPYTRLMKLHCPSMRSIHLRQLMRPMPEGVADPPVWTTLQELVMEASPVEPFEQRGKQRKWQSETQQRFWPQKQEVKEKSWLDKPGAEEEKIELPTPPSLSADAAAALFLRLPRLRSADLLSFSPGVTAEGLALVARMAEVDTLALGGAPVSLDLLHDLGEELAAQFGQLNLGHQMHSMLKLDSDIEQAMKLVAHKEGMKINRLTLAYMRTLEAEEKSDEPAAASSSSGAPNDLPLTLLLSHFSSTLLDLTLESVGPLPDLLCIAQCTLLETLQLVNMRGLPGESLAGLAPLTKLFSLRVVGTRVPEALQQSLRPPSTLLPALVDLFLEQLPEEGAEGEGGAAGGWGAQAHPHAHMMMGAGGGGGGWHHGPQPVVGGVAGYLQPAINWLTNLLHAQAQAGIEEDNDVPELEDEEEGPEMPEVD